MIDCTERKKNNGRSVKIFKNKTINLLFSIDRVPKVYSTEIYTIIDSIPVTYNPHPSEF